MICFVLKGYDAFSLYLRYFALSICNKISQAFICR